MVAGLMCLAPVTASAITPYHQDFETLIQTDPNALGNDGWLVFGNVYTPTNTFLYGYGPFAAPNHALAFSALVTGQGGTEQGAQQLSVFSDYENTDHALGRLIESNVYREWTIAAADTGQVWFFRFQAKRGNIAGATTAMAFIKTLDPNNSYALTNMITADMTAIDTTWGGYTLLLPVGSNLVGQLFQIGFVSTATNYEGSGIFYDNVDLSVLAASGVPDSRTFPGATLGNNYPNPFSPRTRIEFTIEKPGHAELSVYDLAGRKIATLQEGDLAVGEYGVTWDGRTDHHGLAAAGQYWYVLQTPTGRLARRMTLFR